MKTNQGQNGPAKTLVFSSLIAILLGKTNGALMAEVQRPASNHQI
jgi:hypothetical protein